MTRIVVHSKVGPDGVLHMDVPMGVTEANREVRVIVEEVAAVHKASGQEEWHEFYTADRGRLAGRA